jgi:hypothetical protein
VGPIPAPEEAGAPASWHGPHPSARATHHTRLRMGCSPEVQGCSGRAHLGDACELWHRSVACNHAAAAYLAASWGSGRDILCFRPRNVESSQPVADQCLSPFPLQCQPQQLHRSLQEQTLKVLFNASGPLAWQGSRSLQEICTMTLSYDCSAENVMKQVFPPATNIDSTAHGPM